MSYTTLTTLLTMTQDELMTDLENSLRNFGYDPIRTTYALAARSSEPMAPTLVAHLDTKNTHVGDYSPTLDDLFISSEQICLKSNANLDLICLGADDRVGVATILDMLNRGHRPNILFTTDEEISCIGTKKLLRHAQDWLWLETDTCFFIQIDRGVHEDSWYEMVFYRYDYEHIPPLYDKLSKHFDHATGSNTDVALLGEYFNKPLVNLSASYQYEHSRTEFINLFAYDKNLDALDNLLQWVNAQTDRHQWNYEGI